MALALALPACDASFSDLRPTTGDTAGGFTGNDGEMVVLLRGTFAGLNDYQATGVVTIGTVDGELQLRLSEDFTASGVPGPVLVLTERTTLGTQIEASLGDIRVDDLRSTTGAQNYLLSVTASDWQVAWVFCEPFGVEIARADLEPSP